jgi:hypothetical protein
LEFSGGTGKNYSRHSEEGINLHIITNCLAYMSFETTFEPVEKFSQAATIRAGGRGLFCHSSALVCMLASLV